ncbi:hypothetical protein TWF106_006000 [Orbilia oligospora]|uniref:DNA recombination and repair protein Rad51-like C-terminal domain-containing protein n=1 Tax=Orbilia oligospora TaxID=2813651 RepID=A0A6G1ME88_ORBOL|nr:hypothetical protein TWF679_004003 [Orbilia oligospora]KAF3221715.1 hypothetical protein TWF106_006000 [Orbilia oligospora]KAF3225509.1 hypothetical protein TWF191_005214 [Orbilia oligospora]KAF3255333.1 hypothetical protein TWF192_002689 [Orbilia oligospora]
MAAGTRPLKTVGGRGGGDDSGIGKRLLMEVGKSEETLSNLLSDIQLTAQHHNTSSGLLNIPQIDALLRPHLQDHLHNQSIAQAHPQHPVGSFDIPSDDVPLPRDKPAIVEISSNGSGTGKTHLLYYITCVALLPSSWNGINLEGKESAVVFIDCDGRFDILRLSEVMESYIGSRISLAIQFCQSKQARAARDPMSEDVPDPHISSQAEDEEIKEYLTLLSSITPSDIVELTVYCLSHLHVYTPTSSSHFLDILSSIPEYLLSSDPQSSHGLPLSSVIIDGISAFYWLERASSASTTTPSMVFSDPTTSQSTSVQDKKNETNQVPQKIVEDDMEPKLSLQARYDLIISHLLTITTRFNNNTIITNTIIPTNSSHPTSHNNTPVYPRHLPTCYTYSPTFLSARIILSKDVVAPFYGDIGLLEAYKERNMRIEVVRKAGVSAWVEGAGVRKGEVGKKNGGWFWFWIGEGGVKVGAEEDDDD